MFGTPKERLDFYRREIQYETTILANRTDAYLAAQSFLVIAYVSSMGNLNQSWGEMFTLMVPAFLALLGVLSTLNAWPGIRAAFRIIEHWQMKQSHLLRSEPLMGLAYDESPLFCEAETSQAGHRKSLLFPCARPGFSCASGCCWAAIRFSSSWRDQCVLVGTMGDQHALSSSRVSLPVP
ncbi:Hypothetical protein, conserved [Pseudomonas putida BIRD-1]|nr:Hypothetical protein, conserved [Pseudomonas putida BIRD-1]